ncbi:auxin efflux carrier [Suhomyces tanzawaensis NRRL Y-17324]|uniref:Auxin efflux carrier n=1 Tax=Suhomyces tanzawaensis NRRL Y-17324 TaxID=984487 RepID=A0A1E4SNZ9_9ASCO|nr:auxin efflux carrier [Suhomyces tanzawaensis NRRL Y-17324]ODV81249.1 auxin efflux carrier [Suhomyces tanzawaensis NRRL Y-17324]
MTFLPWISDLRGAIDGAATTTATAGPNLSFQQIAFLTFQAVLEVVIICFAGFVAAKLGLLNTKAQKVLSQLNVDLFTPCLVFIKLAPSLSFQKMADLIIIPIFFGVSSVIAYLFSRGVSRGLHLNEPESDFVTAMAVFGNSNSLPVSLTLLLAYTLPDLLWEDVVDDSADKVASRGILYLLIFQQLGQILRWSWGFNTLLRKRSHVELNTYYCGLRHQHADEEDLLLTPEYHGDHDGYVQEPVGAGAESGSSLSASSLVVDVPDHYKRLHEYMHNPTVANRIRAHLTRVAHSKPVSTVLRFMNPPLYAMFLSIVVASVPSLQDIFFTSGSSFIGNTVTKSVSQLGSVSIPLILIVLGSNLYPSKDIPKASRHHTRIVVGALLSRMILPPLVLLPIIAACVKYINISILDDPIFLIVAFVLTISPPAIQLSQIIQLNNIYQKEMSGVLFWGYVVLTLPTTIFIVVASLEVLKWAQ